MLRLVENIQIIIYLVCQESNGLIIEKNGLKQEKSFIAHQGTPRAFLVQSSISNSNVKDMLDCFVDI